ncbi:nucleotidyltransferase family protein [Candidatus Chloroploca sp. Khr17]|uniref:nucleotidyltransferase family protein n=1 Tax=Candidatus Chloroploca sp. Khr17 TaxID=2496869 RepID=UPI00101DC6A2|nr:nucleotidyltransferase domain-containing protein [Candidatus Chloroploca sp. Khr17]
MRAHMTEQSPIDPEQMRQYRATAHRRMAQQREALEVRRQAAWQIAHRAAVLLKTTYDVTRVVLFGSLSRNELFSPHSDIDLVVWGLDEARYYRAVSRLIDLDPSIAIDLLRAEALPTDLVTMIETTGVIL